MTRQEAIDAAGVAFAEALRELELANVGEVRTVSHVEAKSAQPMKRRPIDTTEQRAA